MILEGYRPPIYTVLYILYSRITTAVGCLSSVNSLYGRKTVFYGRIGLFYGRIAFNTYESGYNKSAKNVPTIAVIPTQVFRARQERRIYRHRSGAELDGRGA